MYRIFVVEDDPVIAGAVVSHLKQWGWEVRAADNFADVLAQFAAFAPHLVLLDIGLPFFNGYHWCAEIRKLSQAPILFLSSASDKMNMIMAMNMGADDFLPKPFDLDLLTAKVQALLRRAYAFQQQADLLEHRGAVLDLSDGSLSYQGQRLELTRNEYRILRLLLENRGRTVSRETIMLRLWESDSYIDDNTLTVNVNRLRRRLESIGLPDWIRTKKGAGYLVE